jgi:hypothetical protein
MILLLMAWLMPLNAHAANTVGDVNGDHEVNIADVNAVIDIILGGSGDTTAADVNGDHEVNIADVNTIIDIILRGAAPSQNHEWVDLGLPSGTLWATCNVGASSPEEYGDYFAWGETAPKEVYDISTYKWCNGTYDTMTKYCSDSLFGTVDGKKMLEPEDDAAYMNWGASWRMPTVDQLDELLHKCNIEQTTMNGVTGYLVTGPNGNAIFLPTAGCCIGESLSSEGEEGCYWSNKLDTYFNCVYGLNVTSWDSDPRHGIDIYSRWCGLTVRPVRVEPLVIQPSSLDFAEVPIGETFTQELTIFNYTPEDKTVTVTADAPFSLQQNDGSASTITVVVPGGSISTVTVVLMATVPGEYNCNVTFQHPAIDGGEIAIPVRAGVYSTDVPEYIDLGLPSGTLWATRNVGANNPEDYGEYYAWAETEPKEVYSWETYKWCDGTEDFLTKYCSDSYWGTVDNRIEIVPDDDAAYVNWGSEWRMPSYEQMEELIENCSRKSTTRNRVKGMLFTGPNGNTIFLPAAGYRTDDAIKEAGAHGYYCSRTLGWGNSYVPGGMDFGGSIGWGGSVRERCEGLPVRAVRTTCDEGQRLFVAPDSLDFGEVPLGETRARELTIINYSKESRIVTVTADETFMLKQDEGSVSSMAVEVPGESTIQVTVMFTATTAGEINGHVTFQHPAFDGGQSIIPARAGAYNNDITQPVDLGLPSGTLWAMCNIGASCPEDYGDYFAWGETAPKDVYDWSTYKWCNGSQDTIEKYYWADNKKELDPEDDAACVNWGPEWRMPSDEQIEELIECCTWQCKIRNGVGGLLAIGPNGNSIFLPTTGFHMNGGYIHNNSESYYWSRSLTSFNNCVMAVFMYTKQWSGQASYGWTSRCNGLTVRAVRASQD